MPVALFNDQIVLTGTAGNVPLIFHRDRGKVHYAALLDLPTPLFQLGGWFWFVFFFKLHVSKSPNLSKARDFKNEH